MRYLSLLRLRGQIFYSRRRDLVLVVVVALVTAGLVVTWSRLWTQPDSLAMSSACPSEDKVRRLQVLRRRRIHILPSIPERVHTEEMDAESYTDTGTDTGADTSADTYTDTNTDTDTDADTYTYMDTDPDTDKDFRADCVDTPIPDGSDQVYICIHDPAIDEVISWRLKNRVLWEKDDVAEVIRAHVTFPKLVLVDLGCHVGAYTLPAAKMGMEVIAVDAMESSLKLLQRSLLINDLACHVTLVHNALYSRRQPMRMALDPTNLSGSRLDDAADLRGGNPSQRALVDAICLDDLIPLVSAKDVFLKLDLEGTEAHALACAGQFFTEINVKMVLIQWSHNRHQQEHSETIKSFLTQHHMVPTWGVDLDRVIDLDASHAWPDNVYWMKTR